MPARLRMTAVAAALLLLPACSSDHDPEPDEPSAEEQTCPLPRWNVTEVRRVELRRIDPGGPLLDRELRASRAPNGDLCLDIVIDHADPGSTSVSYSIVARRADRRWRQDGEDPSGQPRLRVAAAGCVTATAVLVVLGAGDRSYRYRARLRAQCEGTTGTDGRRPIAGP